MADKKLPPGQYVPRGWPVLHYGPVPKFKPESWDFRIFGATDSPATLSWSEFDKLPRTTVRGDFHCVTKFSVLESEWGGISTAELLRLAPPQPSATHVMIWAEYGYSANIRMSDFADSDAIFATHRDGEELSADHGFPVRLVVPHLYAWKGPKWARGVEYLERDRRGFWEERGYHNVADPWTEQRYSYQELPGEGPD